MSKDYSERVEARAVDGTVLSAGVVRPEGEPKAVVLAGHAMMTNARSLDCPMGRGLASTLARRGFLVVAADFRGHGKSGTSVSRGGDWSYDDLVRLDMPALVDLARGLLPGATLLVVGQSLMGHVCAAHMGLCPETPIHALVALSSNQWLRNQERRRRRRALKDLRMYSSLAVYAATGHFPARRLRLGSDDEAAQMARQMLTCYFHSFWGTADRTVDYSAALANVERPILVVRGRGDRLSCTSESIRKFHANAPNVTYWEVGRGDHGLTFDPGHMTIVTDPRSAPLWTAIAGWMDDRLREA